MTIDLDALEALCNAQGDYHSPDVVLALIAELRATRAALASEREADRLRHGVVALSRYGRHETECDYAVWLCRETTFEGGPPPCSCGLQQALDAKGGAK
jgi:hypothetical protein